MRIPRLYIDAVLESRTELELNKEQAHYLGRVLRLKAGRPLILFNGQGGEYEAEVARIDGKSARLTISSYRDISRESPLKIELAIGLSKGDRFEWAIQKATELGVTSIQPLMTERVEVRLKADRLEKKLNHWQAIVVSAAEQSWRTALPQLGTVLDFENYLDQAAASTKVILEPTAESGISDLKSSDDLALIVGPEGGFSEQEISLARAKGCQAISMGPRVLRTETVPVAALAAIQSQLGDW